MEEEIAGNRGRALDVPGSELGAEALEAVFNNGLSVEPAELSPAYLAACTDRFSEGRKIGEGAFGTVYRAVDAAMGRRFAVKRLIGGGLQPSVPVDEVELQPLRSSAQREIEVLSRFQHPNIARLLGYTPPTADNHEDSRLPCLVYELAEKGALDNALRDDSLAGELTWRTRVRIALGIAKALNYLHCGGSGERCFHRDVKAANVCLSADLTPKLIDCGLAMLVPDAPGVAGRTMLTASGGASRWAPLGTCARATSKAASSAPSRRCTRSASCCSSSSRGASRTNRRNSISVHIEDEERDLEADTDPGAGEWPPAVADT